MSDGRVAIPELSVPALPSGARVPVSDMSWRTGFSPAQVAVVRLDDPDGATLPHWSQPTPGEGGVRMLDLTTDTWLPVFAEIDAGAEASDGAPALIIRPLDLLPLDHTIAVVVMTSVADRPNNFAALLDGAPPEGTEDLEASTTTVMERLDTLGVPTDEVAVTWSFPVGDGRQPLRSGLAAAEAPSDLVWDELRQEGVDDVPPSTWRAAEGRFTVTDLLGGDHRLERDPDGNAIVAGTAEVYLYAHVPTSAADAAPGSVPVLVFGHGFLSEPGNYLDDPEDPSAVLRLAEAGGFAVIGTRWTGLSRPDVGAAATIAADLSRLPELVDPLVQSQLQTRALVQLLTEGPLADAPVFASAAGPSLLDTSTVMYYGISLGGIEGGVLMAQDTPIQAAVLHVPGGFWSSMLQRSSNWTFFDPLVANAIPSPADRQLLYAMSQLWWDPVDPASWTAELADATILLQESVADEQVPNFTTRALARALQVPQITPAVVEVPGLVRLEPSEASGQGYVQFDPESTPPPDANIAAPVTDAHKIPRRWLTTQEQTLRFLAPDDPGVVIHPCGDAPCSASNAE